MEVGSNLYTFFLLKKFLNNCVNHMFWKTNQDLCGFFATQTPHLLKKLKTPEWVVERGIFYAELYI